MPSIIKIQKEGTGHCVRLKITGAGGNDYKWEIEGVPRTWERRFDGNEHGTLTGWQPGRPFEELVGEILHRTTLARSVTSQNNEWAGPDFDKLANRALMDEVSDLKLLLKSNAERYAASLKAERDKWGQVGESLQKEYEALVASRTKLTGYYGEAPLQQHGHFSSVSCGEAYPYRSPCCGAPFWFNQTAPGHDNACECQSCFAGFSLHDVDEA
jgi:hypothetical protein